MHTAKYDALEIIPVSLLRFAKCTVCIALALGIWFAGFMLAMHTYY